MGWCTTSDLDRFLTLAASRAALAGLGGAQVSEVVLITDRSTPQRQAARLGYRCPAFGDSGRPA